MRLDLNENTFLQALSSEDAPAFWDTVQTNRNHLDPWLRWSGFLKNQGDAEEFILSFPQKDGFHLGIWTDTGLAGGVISHGINRRSAKTEIGYWLAEDFVGQGLVSSASRRVLDYLFLQEKMHRVEIRCAINNVRSRAVAERLNFQLEGIARESEWLMDHFADHAIYSMLVHEWQPT